MIRPIERASISDLFLIAEIGQAHDGSLGMVHSYINAVSAAGIGCIKFQTHIAKAESSEYEPFRINFSYEDKTRYDYWKRMEFTREQWVGIKQHCDDVNIEFLSSPFSIEAVELLEDLGVNRYKIGSGEINNLLMLDVIAQTGKDIILSIGLTDYNELDKTVKFIEQYHNNISILNCTTSYPTQANQIGYNVIQELKEKYPNYKIGLSDHSSKTTSLIAARALGADILEFHVCFDHQMFGPDSTSSLEVRELKGLVGELEFLDIALSNPIDKSKVASPELKMMFSKSLAVRRGIKKGEIIRMEDLETKKPNGYGISANEYKSVIGEVAATDIPENGFINIENIQ